MWPANQLQRTVSEWFSQQRAAYSQGAHRPIAGYTAALAAYWASTTAVVALARATGHAAPRLGPGDTLMLAIATHKISRTLAKDPITSPLRMPFTQFEGASAPSELHEEVRSSGKEHAVGELVSCPFCLSAWVASALLTGYTFAPRGTQAVTTLFTAVTGADFLQYTYAATQQRTIPQDQR